MAVPMTADKMVAALRAEGVTVVEHRSWRTHNRNSVGSWGPVHGVMIHHTVTTGTTGSVELCYSGRSDLPGPLCHGVIAKDGTVYLVGHGRANHAGSGDGDVLAAVIDEGPLPVPRNNDTDGNTHFYGFECVNLGDNEDPWPAAQVEAIVRASAALCRAHGWGEEGPASVIGHLEWQHGKVDPRGPGVSMNAIRARVWDRLDRPSDWNPGGNDMPGLLAVGMTKPLEISPGSWVSVAMDTEWSDPLDQHSADGQTFLTGATYTGDVYVALSGLTPGREVQVRLVEDRDGQTVRSYPLGEGVGTGEKTMVRIPATGRTPAGNRLKVRVAHFGEGPAVLERVEVKFLVWGE
jgi:hypothetical protein